MGIDKFNGICANVRVFGMKQLLSSQSCVKGLGKEDSGMKSLVGGVFRNEAIAVTSVSCQRFRVQG
jgi:hypothetical protein